MRTALQREQHCRATWCDRVRGKRQMSDRIRLSVTTVQKTQNRKTLGGVGGGAVLTPHSLPVAPAAFGQHTDVRDRWRSRAGKRSRGERRGGGSPPPPAHVVGPLCGDKMTQCRHRRNTATLLAERTRVSRTCVPVRRDGVRRPNHDIIIINPA